MKYLKKIKNILVVIVGFNSYLYGNIGIVRLYTRFPRFLPINVRIQHGWYQQITSFNEDLITDRPLMLVWSKRIAEIWKEKSNIPVEILGSPFILYRRMKNIVPKKDARGTVAFPHHSTKSTEAVYELEEYCKALHNLPEDYKPITVCLHYMDFDNQSPLYKKNGFKVVTAGKSHIWGFKFVNSFYNILSQHKYSTSNNIGSYTFYSVEMGIPFFISGKEGSTKLRQNQKKLSTNTVFEKSEFMGELLPLFSKICKTISSEQRRIVLDEVGINDAISPKDLRQLFFKNMTLSKIIGRVNKNK